MILKLKIEERIIIINKKRLKKKYQFWDPYKKT